MSEKVLGFKCSYCRKGHNGTYKKAYCSKECNNKAREGETKMIIHIGKRIPKGFVECANSIHLGKGVWMFEIEKEAKK